MIRHGSAELVELAEAKLRGEANDPAAFTAIMDGLLSQPGGHRIDTVVLACTHFPLVVDELRSAFGEGVAFVDGAEGIARRIAYLTRNNDFRRERPDFAVVTGPLDAVDPLRPALARYGLEEVAAF